jgi:hypothetical protein
MSRFEAGDSHHRELVHASEDITICFIIVHSCQGGHASWAFPCGMRPISGTTELYVLAPGILPYKVSSSAVQPSA